MFDPKEFKDFLSKLAEKADSEEKYLKRRKLDEKEDKEWRELKKIRALANDTEAKLKTYRKRFWSNVEIAEKSYGEKNHKISLVDGEYWLFEESPES